MVRLGIIGLGAAAQAFITPFKRHPDFEIVAACDPSPEARADFAERFDIKLFHEIDALIAAGLCEAVYIGTPTDLHFAHAKRALEAGLNVLLEKPMCIRAEDGIALARLAKSQGLVLMIGHSHSHDLPIRKMREIIQSGRLGSVKMINTWCYSDWVYRPRRPDELRSELGGGVTYRQGGHQFDILRSLCGDDVVSVSGHTFDLDPERSTIGAHNATLTFANGAVGTAVYNGYGHFLTSDLTEKVGEWGYPAQPRPHASQGNSSSENELKQKRLRSKSAIGNDAPHQPHFGLTLVSCEKGDIRQSPDGLIIYTNQGCEAMALDNSRSPREFVLDELSQAIAGLPYLHDGFWGASIVSICDAVLESASTGRPVPLSKSE